MRLATGFIFALGNGIIAYPVSANDSTAVLGAGGVELTASDKIVMEEETLFLSPEKVRVHYVFRNDGDNDITTRVAFPLPVVAFGPDDNLALPDFEHENFVGFTVTADHQKIEPVLEQRAVLDDGTDITVAVKKAGLPVNANLPLWQRSISAMKRDTLRKLVSQGLLEATGDAVESADDIVPAWNLHATYHWEQKFPAHQPIAVEHQYKPVVGSAYFVGEHDDMASVSQRYEKKYCLDRTGKAGIHRLLDRAREANKQHADSTFVLADELDYVLKTGANWKGPIDRFELTIDKLKPDAILSMCGSSIRKTGPTTFKVEKVDFEPTSDIGFAVFHLEKRAE